MLKIKLFPDDERARKFAACFYLLCVCALLLFNSVLSPIVAFFFCSKYRATTVHSNDSEGTAPLEN